ncbi:unnamed protein product [Dracunculus medinensis]|uniref:WD_REPEATS_REGION domain-containing protein n=1 Tax=Dracunculus medinensis TaxID=318479 RepID=A0A0N4U5N3_DRAME|nr:unnamed protein product [Dracunculus medinensis]
MKSGKQTLFEAKVDQNRAEFVRDIESRSGAHNTTNLTRQIFCKELATRRSVGLNGYYIPSQQAAICNMFRPVRKIAKYTFHSDESIRLFKRPLNWTKMSHPLIRSYRVPEVGWSILDLAVSPNQMYMTYSTWSERIFTRKIDSDEENALHWNGAIFSICYNSEGTQIYCARNGGILSIYDLEKQQLSNEVIVGQLQQSMHRDDINAVCFINKDLFATGGDDLLCKVWDRRQSVSENSVGFFGGHRDGIVSIDTKGDDRYILTSSKDQSIKIWDLRMFSPNSACAKALRSAVTNNFDYRYDLVPNYKKERQKDDTWLVEMRGHLLLHTLIRARFSPDYTGNRYVYTGCAKGRCLVYDLLTGQIVREYDGHKSVVRDSLWNPYENELITTSVVGWKYYNMEPP